MHSSSSYGSPSYSRGGSAEQYRQEWGGATRNLTYLKQKCDALSEMQRSFRQHVPPTNPAAACTTQRSTASATSPQVQEAINRCNALTSTFREQRWAGAALRGSAGVGVGSTSAGVGGGGSSGGRVGGVGGGVSGVGVVPPTSATSSMSSTATTSQRPARTYPASAASPSPAAAPTTPRTSYHRAYRSPAAFIPPPGSGDKLEKTPERVERVLKSVSLPRKETTPYKEERPYETAYSPSTGEREREKVTERRYEPFSFTPSISSSRPELASLESAFAREREQEKEREKEKERAYPVSPVPSSSRPERVSLESAFASPSHIEREKDRADPPLFTSSRPERVSLESAFSREREQEKEKETAYPVSPVTSSSRLERVSLESAFASPHTEPEKERTDPPLFTSSRPERAPLESAFVSSSLHRVEEKENERDPVSPFTSSSIPAESAFASSFSPRVEREKEWEREPEYPSTASSKPEREVPPSHSQPVVFDSGSSAPSSTSHTSAQDAPQWWDKRPPFTVADTHITVEQPSPAVAASPQEAPLETALEVIPPLQAATEQFSTLSSKGAGQTSIQPSILSTLQVSATTASPLSPGSPESPFIQISEPGDMDSPHSILKGSAFPINHEDDNDDIRSEECEVYEDRGVFALDASFGRAGGAANSTPNVAIKVPDISSGSSSEALSPAGGHQLHVTSSSDRYALNSSLRGSPTSATAKGLRPLSSSNVYFDMSASEFAGDFPSGDKMDTVPKRPSALETLLQIADGTISSRKDIDSGSSKASSLKSRSSGTPTAQEVRISPVPSSPKGSSDSGELETKLTAPILAARGREARKPSISGSSALAHDFPESVRDEVESPTVFDVIEKSKKTKGWGSFGVYVESDYGSPSSSPVARKPRRRLARIVP